jgi:hypothetical protein
MKRFAPLLVLLPFWYFALVVNHHTAIQFGPFSSESQCNALATQFTVFSVLPPPQVYPFFIPKSTATACWSDS